MNVRSKSFAIVFLILFNLALAWLHTGSRIQSLPEILNQYLTHSLPNRLERFTKAALEPTSHTMEFRSIQQVKLLANDKANNDSFGISVSVSADGNTALIGAFGEGDADWTTSGASYVFTRVRNIWTLQAKLLASDKDVHERFGSSVSISADGNTALIGASDENDSGTSANGAVYVFTRVGNTWSQQAKLLADDKATRDFFGVSVSVSMDGNTALIGAYGKDVDGTIDNGAAYVFTHAGNVWSQQAKLLAGDKAATERFGASVSISADGNTALIGALGKADAVYIFTRDGDAWTPQTKFLGGNSVSVSADGNTALIGSLRANSGSIVTGAAYVFTRTGNVWTQQDKLLAADKSLRDNFGYSVSLSADGNTALIGAYSESDSGTIANGAAYVFVEALPTATPTPTNTVIPH